MWDGFNQRKFLRIKRRCEMTILPEGETSPIVTMTENIGVGGVAVIQDHRLERFTKCLIRLELEQDLPEIECHGKVVWIIESKEPTVREHKFDTGIEFTDITPEARERIQSFIRKRLPKGFEEIT